MRSKSTRTRFDVRVARSFRRVGGWTVVFVLAALALAAVAGLAIAFLGADRSGDAELQQGNEAANGGSWQEDGVGEAARQQNSDVPPDYASRGELAAGNSSGASRAVIGQRSDRWSASDVSDREGESWSDRRQRLAGEKIVRNRGESGRSQSGFGAAGGRSGSGNSPEAESAFDSDGDEGRLDEGSENAMEPVDLLDVITPGFVGAEEGFEIYAVDGKNARWAAEVQKRLSAPDLPDPVSVDLFNSETGERVQVLISQKDLMGAVGQN